MAKDEHAGVKELALAWAKARNAVLKLPQGTDQKEFRAKLNDLSNAEDALFQHCRQFVRLD